MGTRKMSGTQKGFTLIELMIVVAIVGVLAAIAIPAYRDYVKRAKMSEVLTAIDAVAQGSTEYHGVMGYFPDESYTAQNLANFSEDFATITIINETDPYTDMRIRAAFNSSLDLTDLDAGSYGLLEMVVSYSVATGYNKQWDFSSTTIDAIYMPR